MSWSSLKFLTLGEIEVERLIAGRSIDTGDLTQLQQGLESKVCGVFKIAKNVFSVIVEGKEITLFEDPRRYGFSVKQGLIRGLAR